MKLTQEKYNMNYQLQVCLPNMPRSTNIQTATNACVCELWTVVSNPQSKCSTAEVTVTRSFIAIVRAYRKVITSFTPFVCLLCTQQLHKAELSNLHSQIAALKQELREIHSRSQTMALSRSWKLKWMSCILPWQPNHKPTAQGQFPLTNTAARSPKLRGRRAPGKLTYSMHKVQVQFLVLPKKRRVWQAPGSYEESHMLLQLRLYLQHLENWQLLVSL